MGAGDRCHAVSTADEQDALRDAAWDEPLLAAAAGAPSPAAAVKMLFGGSVRARTTFTSGLELSERLATSLPPLALAGLAAALMAMPALLSETLALPGGVGALDAALGTAWRQRVSRINAPGGALAAAGFDLGAPVPVAEPEWSASHKGVCLYAWRVLQAAWDAPVAAASRAAPQLLKCKFSADALQVGGLAGGGLWVLCLSEKGPP